MGTEQTEIRKVEPAPLVELSSPVSLWASTSMTDEGPMLLSNKNTLLKCHQETRDSL